MSPLGPLEGIARARVVPVVVVDDAAQGVLVASALRDGGLPVAEVTFRTAGARAAIEAIAREVPDVLVGAGTVVTAAQVDEAVDAGARFLVSPGLSAAVVRRAQELGVPVVPGVATPSDVIAALDLGLDVVKLFPANVVGGPAAVKAFSAPFPGLRFVPTGGVGAANLLDYLALPAVLAAGGSWMVDAALVRAGDTAEITRRTREAVALAATAPHPAEGA
ncbi:MULTISPECIES: bifunctional 4-hydroxy-2-oxoglutarate aldolase/2-dehydro-3-deoxy-phosphogluconate aldolase [Cellulosimicrobium]|jgi:2-dehydro-3-deoxyphosphogluconate aldolase / (4S)-4-hydroxy-2-oxoglutarate aldolase|uniref:bifunctional 4-hydroxy-2-oxoglutarate aldolase/2-dehydro-3-deoxy-phosphogluconate aldolase n=1 Tax=Cellulosimicrobium TaxID=157920 RepID=UPI001BA469E4|nr:bifunctional 4-hydroxy-2-oxoglutarate aldolase/2-dehydro-3-deoxy-phosphogluconate aldolase [Cellulosimicrobium cellulans]QUB98156.1 bifunctional 4-hydroxy-2-oxoglutarate aldolase/2-dehydro-3-deoxy-phosphogluconate aldolase [Cellulosimicrobium cellulans]